LVIARVRSESRLGIIPLLARDVIQIYFQQLLDCGELAPCPILLRAVRFGCSHGHLLVATFSICGFLERAAEKYRPLSLADRRRRAIQS
jgi:hypothetical protein